MNGLSIGRLFDANPTRQLPLSEAPSANRPSLLKLASWDPSTHSKPQFFFVNGRILIGLLIDTVSEQVSQHSRLPFTALQHPLSASFNLGEVIKAADPLLSTSARRSWWDVCMAASPEQRS